MDDYNLFEEYLENQLNPEEKARFELRLKEDPAFFNEFDQYRLLDSDMLQWRRTENQRLQLRQTLDRITGKNKSPAILRPIRWYLWRVAAVFILAAATWWLFAPPGFKSNNELFAQYSSGENITLTRGGNSDSLWEKISANFYDKKYAAAASTLDQIISSGKDSSGEAIVWLSYCQMQTNNNSTAENLLTHYQFKQKDLAERAEWYKALLYLKTGRKDLCLTTLSELQTSGGDYANKAKALLKEKIH